MNSSSASDNKPNILIVDDEVDIAELVAEYLEMNYSVSTANSLSEARLKISDRLFELIVTDLQLPDCGAQSSVHHLRQTNFLGPILLVTGQDEFDPAVRRALLDGAQGLVKKPFSLESVASTIGRALLVKKSA